MTQPDLPKPAPPTWHWGITCEDCGAQIGMDDAEWYDGPVCTECHKARSEEGSNICPECGFYIWPWMNSCC